jgi:hypothetical protein
MRSYATVVVIAGVALFSSASAHAQFVQQGSKLVGSGYGLRNPATNEGASVALSSDGTTAIVGSPTDGGNIGAFWIFTRSGTTWTQQGSKLVASDATPSAQQGYSVALSADGSTAIVGGPADSADAGAAWIFVRSGTTWAQQGSKLVGSGAAGPAFQGSSVALSADGNTALVGGPGDGAASGAAWVFIRSGSGWTQQGQKLTGFFGGGVASEDQGQALALSADGNTALVSVLLDGIVNAGFVFTRSGSTWTQENGGLACNPPGAGQAIPTSVALSADGNTAAIGEPNDTSTAGSVSVFTRSGSSWTQQGSRLIGTGAVGSAIFQGSSVSLSSNGNMLLEGGYGDDGNKGAAWAFVRTGGTWSQVGGKLVGSGAAGTPSVARQGWSAALSSDGLTAIVGGPTDNSVGAAWIFTQTLPALPPHAAGDADGDGLADMTRVTTAGDWATLRSAGGFTLPSTVNWTAAGSIAVRGDFDGDGREDPALYDPATGAWRILTSSSTYTTPIVVNWGGAGYTAVPGDYDGDGKADPAVYNMATGVWSILESSTNYSTTMTVGFGGPGYVPVPGQDFDGDFIADIAVYQPSTGLWAVLKSSTAWATGFSVIWGGPGYWLVPGDYDGDRKTDLAVYQPSTGWWYVLKSGNGFTTALSVNWGGGGYVPVPGDYDGDAKIDLGLYRPATGSWYVLKSSTSYSTTLTIANWGSGGDAPVSSAIRIGGTDLARAGDLDGDGRSEITVYNTSTGFWSSLTSASNYGAARNTQWGGAGYTVVPGDYDGDGKSDVGIYQTATGTWFVLLSSTGFATALTRSAGGAGWTPQPGDYDGDGRTDIVVYDTVTGQWYGLLSGSGYTASISVNYGGAGYAPVAADFDGDGRIDIGVYRGATGDWSILLSSTNYTTSLSKSAGGVNYTPVPADYDGDGRADFVVYNTSTGLWYGLLSSGNYMTTLNVSWGGSGYTPVMGDYDGDGRADLALYVASTGDWCILLSSANYTTTLTKNWGGPGYTAVPTYP